MTRSDCAGPDLADLVPDSELLRPQQVGWLVLQVRPIRGLGVIRDIRPSGIWPSFQLVKDATEPSVKLQESLTLCSTWNQLFNFLVGELVYFDQP
jgi:hypothetical protein